MLIVQSLWSRLAFCHTEYDLLSPARRCNNTLPQGEWNYEHLRDTLSAAKEKLKAAGKVDHLSIYFQDLDHGPRFGIGEYDKFEPASLLKVPLAIFFLHAADLDPEILDKQLSFTGQLKIDDNLLSPAETIQPDTLYTIRELLEKMIIYSDNRSYSLLLREMHSLSESVAYYTFRDLDVLQIMLETEDTYVSISSYAKLFGVLYNTGYLSKDMSQYALDLLSRSTFREGIVSGLPEDLRVAHKFGFRFAEGQGQLHDCGIVYHPKMAYILCVMTSGKDVNNANAAISAISTIVYESVSSLDISKLEEGAALP
ncbi:class A beta-lactamase-related serine hydrolase [Candidatus Peribacteria bacterium]|nr:MAG: class A beta-lactamase-related serine hydrolase [Candidatus Peribacteria bacterium]